MPTHTNLPCEDLAPPRLLLLPPTPPMRLVSTRTSVLPCFQIAIVCGLDLACASAPLVWQAAAAGPVAPMQACGRLSSQGRGWLGAIPSGKGWLVRAASSPKGCSQLSCCCVLRWSNERIGWRCTAGLWGNQWVGTHLAARPRCIAGWGGLRPAGTWCAAELAAGGNGSFVRLHNGADCSVCCLRSVCKPMPASDDWHQLAVGIQSIMSSSMQMFNDRLKQITPSQLIAVGRG